MAKGIRTIWIDSDTVGVTGTKVYRDGLLIDTVAQGIQEYKDPNVAPDVEYEYILQAVTADGESVGEVLGVNKAFYTIEETPVTGLMPVLSKFRIENAEPSRVYFDVVGDITGLTTTGFVISGNTVISVDTVNNYFTVDQPFTFWDNNTIRLGEVQDTSDRQTILHNFTLEHVVNNIAEPETNPSNDRYVTSVATGGGNGLTEGTAWTWADAATNVTNDMTIWVKAGNYIDIPQVSFINKDGLTDAPIKIIGYKTTIDDISGNYWDVINDNWDVTGMPTITHAVRTDRTALYIENSSFFIVRNIQLDNVNRGILAYAPTHLITDNCNVRSPGNLGVHYTTNFTDASDTDYVNSHSRIINSKVKNAIWENFLIQASNLLTKDCESYCDFGTTTSEATDYYYAVKGSNNILINNYAAKSSTDPAIIGHIGHGFSIKTEPDTYGIKDTYGTVITERNLVADNIVDKVGAALYARNYGVNYNVYKRNTLTSDYTTANVWNAPQYMTAFPITNGATYNVFEDNKVTNVGIFTYFSHNSEGEHPTPTVTSNNIIRNNIVDGLGFILYATNTYATTSFSIEDNKFYNNTINNVDYFDRLRNDSQPYTIINNEFKNNILNDIDNGTANLGYPLTETMFSFDYDNWFGIGYSVYAWAANVSTVDPGLDANYLPSGAIQLAPRLFGVEYDYNEKERDTTTTIGGITLTSEQVGEQPNVTPVINTFRIENDTPDRIYFDSVGDISTLTAAGFYLGNGLGKTILSINTVDKYFVVSSDFTFWDNDSIRLDGGNGTIYDFTLQYIENNIPEPTASNYRYVSLTGDNGNDGLSEGTAWRTLSYAHNELSEGMTLWAKAGDYGDDRITVATNGAIDNPIKIIGYTTSITDPAPDLNWDYADTTPWNTNDPLAHSNGFDSTLMPLISGTDEVLNRGIESTGDYVIIKNFQVQFYQRTIAVNGVHTSNLIDNCYAANATYGFLADQSSNSKIRVTNSLSFRCQTAGLRVYGDNNLFSGMECWDDRTEDEGNPPSYSQDYYISYNGNSNIVRGNHVERVGGVSDHTGHGFSCKGTSTTEHNLCENSTSINVSRAIEYWEAATHNNIARNLHLIGNYGVGPGITGSNFSVDSSNNTLENITWDGFENALFSSVGTHENLTIKNSVIKNCGNIVRLDVTGNSGWQILNTTIYNVDNFADLSNPSPLAFVNCIFDTVPLEGNANAGNTYEYCNIWNSYTNTLGTNSTNLDPDFVDAANGDFIPQNELLLAPKVVGVDYDYNDKERAEETTRGAITLVSENAGTQPPVEEGVFAGAKGFGSQWVFDQDYEVKVVTTLNDSGTGSLREAITAANVKPSRIIVFNGLSGVITLNSVISCNPGLQLYIAGQTSENGIIIEGTDYAQSLLRFSNTAYTSGLILRGVGFFRGLSPTAEGTNNDCLAISGDDVMVDRCCFFWASDENVQVWGGCEGVTFQNNIIAEPLWISYASPESPNSLGLIFGTDDTGAVPTKISTYNNMFMHCGSRTPVLYLVDEVEIQKNTVYNSISQQTHLADDYGIQKNVNFRNNYSIDGADTSGFGLSLAISTSDFIKAYVEGNINTYRTAAGQDEWLATRVYNTSTIAPTSQQSLTPFDYPLKDEAIVSETELFNSQIASGGVGTFKRNSAETRVIDDAINITGTIISDPAVVGGTPSIAAGTIITDSNSNGIPDELEGTWGNDTFGYVNYLADNFPAV